MWQSLLPWLATGLGLGGGGGLIMGIVRVVYRLHADAVDAERRRADDARDRAHAAEKRADLREEQIGILLGRVHEPAP